MSSFKVLNAGNLEGRRKPIARELGARAVKLNQFDSQPNQVGHEHDEVESGQEELYLALRGSGILRVDHEEVALRPGIYVLVPPESRRVVVAGPEGLSYAVAGAEFDSRPPS
jgi:quercetin dioxygenase-like cupin family protein